MEVPQLFGDGAGGFEDGWQVLGEHWTEMVPLTGRSADHPAGTLAKQRYRISLRAAPVGSSARPKPGQRFRKEARIWHIETVCEADRHGRYLACFCTEELMQ